MYMLSLVNRPASKSSAPVTALIVLCVPTPYLCSGPVQEVLPYFAESIGFACPVRKDPGSFLQVGEYVLLLMDAWTTALGVHHRKHVQACLAIRPTRCGACAGA